MKKKLIRSATILLAAISFAAGTICAATAQESALVANIKKRGVVRAAVDVAPPNLILNAQTNKWEGVFVDLLDAWAKELGVKAEYQQTAFSQMVAAVQADRADIALDLTVNAERLKGAKFSIPVRGDVGVFLIGKSMPNVKSFADLNKPEIKFCVQQGGVYDNAITPVGMKSEILRLPNAAACFAALDAGRVDAMYWGWSVAAQYCKKNAGQGAGIIFTPEPYVKSDIANALSLNYTGADLKPLDDFTRAWIDSPSGLKASLQRWNADASPLECAIGEIPQYVKDAVPGTFGKS
jgi:polar amino acid transport system substrate-binding protein